MKSKKVTTPVATYFTCVRIALDKSQLIKIYEFENGSMLKEIIKEDLHGIVLAHLMQHLNEVK